MDAELTILVATTEDQVRACFPAFAELRPHLDEETFVARWRTQSAEGYEIAYVEDAGRVVAAAGYREMTMMALGHIVYLDDLVALPAVRGRGLGRALLVHLQAETVRRGCAQLHLDTGYARHDAHRSYLRNGFDLVCHHLAWTPPSG